MPDQSTLDSKYFIDRFVYNCPFCNRRNVQYHLTSWQSFNWTESKKCYIYIIECTSCDNESMHLSFTHVGGEMVSNGPKGVKYRFKTEEKDLDKLFFYSVPSSFHVIDERIPRTLRELLTEAEGCLKSNFLTGASACARKLVYELAIIEKAKGQDYESRLKSLKEIRPDIDPEYFDTLLTIQQVTSTKVHEESYDGWQSKHLRLILASLLEILNLLYVEPKRRQERREAILGLKSEIMGARPSQNKQQEQASETETN